MRAAADQGRRFRPPSAHPAGDQPRRLAGAETDCAERSPQGERRDGARWSQRGTRPRDHAPEAARGPLRDQIRYARELYDADRWADAPGVQLPHAFEWKAKKAAISWEWYWVFPSPVISKDPRSGIERRHHVHEDSVQRSIRAAAKKVGISKRVTPHILRHSLTHSPRSLTLRAACSSLSRAAFGSRLATHLLERGQDICRSLPSSRPAGSLRLAVSRRHRRSAAPSRNCSVTRTSAPPRCTRT
jgi:integrase